MVGPLHKFLVIGLLWGMALLLTPFSWATSSPQRSAPPPLPWSIPSDVLAALSESESYQVPPSYRCHDPLINELLESSLSTGKRLRPWLCYTFGGMAGLSPVTLLPLARLAEWTHGASLMHDDVLDKSEQRRGRPALWKTIGQVYPGQEVSLTILLGDWLLGTLVSYGLEAPLPHLPPLERQKGQLVSSLTRAIASMTEGEFLQNRLLQQGTYNYQEWETVAIQKTGLLFSWSATAPARLLDLSAELIAEIDKFALGLSQLFQAYDDVEDAEEVEVNLLRLLAAKKKGTSPLSPLSKQDLDAAMGEYQTWQHQLVSRLKLQLINIQTRFSEELIISSEKASQDCAQSLLSFVHLLSPPLSSSP